MSGVPYPRPDNTDQSSPSGRLLATWRPTIRPSTPSPSSTMLLGSGISLLDWASAGAANSSVPAAMINALIIIRTQLHLMVYAIAVPWSANRIPQRIWLVNTGRAWRTIVSQPDGLGLSARRQSSCTQGGMRLGNGMLAKMKNRGG